MKPKRVIPNDLLKTLTDARDQAVTIYRNAQENNQKHAILFAKIADELESAIVRVNTYLDTGQLQED